MPSGHSGSGSGGHFGGGSFSHSGGHFSGSSFSRPSGGHFGSSGYTPRPRRPFYQPRVVVFGGRSIYLDSGRASTVSVLGGLIAFVVFITIILGLVWATSGDEAVEYQEEMAKIEADFNLYQKMAQNAITKGTTWQVAGTVGGYNNKGQFVRFEQFRDTGKYCIFYSFTPSTGSKVDNGTSFYVYTYDEVVDMMEHGVQLALECSYATSEHDTDSVPLDFANAKLDDDAEYVYYSKLYNEAQNENQTENDGIKIGFFVSAGILLLLVASYVLVNATAKKATAEQIAAEKQGTIPTADNKTTPAGTWRCEYCNVLNDNAKERCDGCGAKRQK